MDYNIHILEEYYKNPIIESWTYVSMGMDNLRIHDPGAYKKIKDKQSLLISEKKERLKDIKQTSDALGLDYREVDFCIEEFLQKFPLSLRQDVGWDDPNFIFLYILIKMLKPKVIIETGSNVGFSSSFIALAVKENNNNCRFYTMEPNELIWSRTSLVTGNITRKQKINYNKLLEKCEPLCIVPPDLKKYIIFMKGSSKDILPGLLRDNGKIDIFFHDSEHSYRNTIWESLTALPCIRMGGYILVHDIMLNSAFEELFSKENSVIAVRNGQKHDLGISRKITSNYITIEKEWVTPNENSLLNHKEYQFKKIKLNSSPREIIIQITNCNNSNCFFCSERIINEKNDFDIFFQLLIHKISRYISQAERITFKSCGSFFNSSEVKKMILWGVNILESSFPEVNKTYYSNGLDLTPNVCEFITKPPVYNRKDGSKPENIVNILLCASNASLYKTLTGRDDFSKIIAQIQYLKKIRKDKYNPAIYFTFIATSSNIEDLPGVVKLASDLDIGKIICQYNHIYKSTQKHPFYSLNQEIINKIFNSTKKLAEKLNIEIELPFKFAQKEDPGSNHCHKAWDQMIVSPIGDILSCDRFEDCQESLQKKDFMEVWNGHYYQNLRKSLIEKDSSCFEHCLRINSVLVNDFCISDNSAR